MPANKRSSTKAKIREAHSLTDIPVASDKQAIVAAVKAKTQPLEGQVINQGGRPSEFTQALADSICDMLSSGYSIRTIANEPDMPAARTIYYWLRTHETFLQQYARAKQDGADAIADEIQSIAAGTLKGLYDPQAARVAIDAYKWTASKLKPKVYGDKLDLTTDGKELPTPIFGGLAVSNNTTDDVKTTDNNNEVPQITAPEESETS